MVVSDVITRVRDILNDESGSRWSDARIIRELNAAQRDFCSKTNILRTAESLIVHSGQSIYTLPSDVRVISRVLYNDSLLQFMPYNKMDGEVSQWEFSTGTPKYVIFDKLNRQLLRISPIPAFEEAEEDLSNYLTVYYLKHPDPAVATTDILELEDMYLESLVLFITGSLLRADMDTQNRVVGNEQLQLYAIAVREAYIEASKEFTTNANVLTFDYRGGF